MFDQVIEILKLVIFGGLFFTIVVGYFVYRAAGRNRILTLCQLGLAFIALCIMLITFGPDPSDAVTGLIAALAGYIMQKLKTPQAS